MFLQRIFSKNIYLKKIFLGELLIKVFVKAFLGKLPLSVFYKILYVIFQNLIKHIIFSSKIFFRLKLFFKNTTKWNLIL